ncbi:hypothetical protein Nepgr_026607 [Nepenthes gracilis]|uniref:Uncharacterized protein n=1 Tax=Nepenthes gracilis TaxID=150966 RepID=A0AAD3Y287_NEPGR|nr:hypothetical protein Nepgr_026607 [Nepenthes gracilis]
MGSNRDLTGRGEISVRDELFRNEIGYDGGSYPRWLLLVKMFRPRKLVGKLLVLPTVARRLLLMKQCSRSIFWLLYQTSDAGFGLY